MKHAHMQACLKVPAELLKFCADHQDSDAQMCVPQCSVQLYLLARRVCNHDDVVPEDAMLLATTNALMEQQIVCLCPICACPLLTRPAVVQVIADYGLNSVILGFKDDIVNFSGGVLKLKLDPAAAGEGGELCMPMKLFGAWAIMDGGPRMHLLTKDEPGIFSSETGAFHVRKKLQGVLGKLTGNLILLGLICPDHCLLPSQDFVITPSDPTHLPPHPSSTHLAI
eukprot:3767299-Rhodomonas_salina.1